MAVGTALAVSPQPGAWPYFGLVAISVTFGFETLRALLSLLVYVLRDGYRWDAVQVGILALVIFATGFQAGPLTRVLGASTSLVIAAGGLGLTRLLAHSFPVFPLVDLGLSIAGTFLFILFIYAAVEHSRTSQGPGAANCGLGVLLGIALDTFIMGAFDTWEPFWRIGVGPTWTVTFMFMAQVTCIISALVLGRMFSADPPSNPVSEASQQRSGSAVPWLALGPVIFLQLQVFQNIAAFAAVTGWTLPQAFFWLVISNVVGLLIAAIVAFRPSTAGAWAPTLLMGILLAASLVFQDLEARQAAAALMVGQALLSALLIVVFNSFEPRPARDQQDEFTTPPEERKQERTPRQGSAFYGIGMILLVALLFGYYASLELEMPFSRNVLLPVAGAIVGLAALRASSVGQAAIPPTHGAWKPATFAMLFAIAPVVGLLTWQAPQPEVGEGYPVRVMTYNLHNGFNTDGELDLEDLAEVIESEEPDIVALQEVSRGWVINGSADMLLWLSQRLDMPYLYGPSMADLWGNAIVSRYPVTDWGTGDLPPRDLPLLRQFTWADFDLGEGQKLRVIATHFHHPEDGGETRLLQTEEVLSFWNAYPQTVVLGDLNANPDWPEMLGFWRAGFTDALEEVESRATFPSDQPIKKIDYVLASPGLELSYPSVPITTASDHLPVVATVDLRN